MQIVADALLLAVADFEDFTFQSRTHSAYRLKLFELIDAVSLASHQRFCPCTRT